MIATLLVALCLASADEPKRIVDSRNPKQTSLLDADEAKDVAELEQTTEQIADDQESLEAGRIKQEEYDRALAEKTRRIAATAASREG